MKLKERVMISISMIFVMLTLILVVDLQTDMGITRQHFLPSHAIIKFNTSADGPGGAYNAFQRRFLLKGNVSKESGGGGSVLVQGGSGGSGASQQQQQEIVGNGGSKASKYSSSSTAGEEEQQPPHDDFKQLYEYVFATKPGRKFIRNGVVKLVNNDDWPNNPTIQELLGIQYR